MVIEYVYLTRKLEIIKEVRRTWISFNNLYPVERTIRKGDIPDLRHGFYLLQHSSPYLRGSMYGLVGKKRTLLARFGD